MGARAGISLTKRDFQITNEKREGEGGFLDYKRDFRFTIHQRKVSKLGTFLFCVKDYNKKYINLQINRI